MTTRSTLLAATVLAGFAAVAAEAQQRSFGSLDANGDDLLTQEELAAAFGAGGAARVLERQDLDGDGTLTRSEVRANSTDDDDGRGGEDRDDGERGEGDDGRDGDDERGSDEDGRDDDGGDDDGEDHDGDDDDDDDADD